MSHGGGVGAGRPWRRLWVWGPPGGIRWPLAGSLSNGPDPQTSGRLVVAPSHLLLSVGKAPGKRKPVPLPLPAPEPVDRLPPSAKQVLPQKLSYHPQHKPEASESHWEFHRQLFVS